MKLVFAAIVITLVSACSQELSEDIFQWPEVKPENKPGVYWWWMGSAVDRDGLDYNLENLEKAGIGNVLVVPIYGVNGEEHRYIDFLTPEWVNMLSYAADKANELNINVDMSTGTGWPFGGSHVTPEYAAKKLLYKIITVSGGEKVNELFNVENLVAITAFSKDNRNIDLTKKIKKDGRLMWKAPEGEWDIYVLHTVGTGQKVKRAAPGNEGLVLDPYSVDAMKFYLKRFDDAFSDRKKIKLRSQYHDSFEYYNANWTDDFFDNFKSGYGYDLRLHLPALLDTNRTNFRVKSDYRRFLAELHLEYIKAWNNWSHKNGWISRNEAHGAPGNLLDLYAACDIPETETFGSGDYKIPGYRYVKENTSTSSPPNPLILKFASSAAHVSGNNLVASETATWLRDHFKVALSQVKPELDELFVSGINHIFYHGNAYSPKDAQWPGWLFYASTHFEKENAFWKDFPELNAYVTRCQSVLQAGRPANDILLYWPVEDIYHSFPDKLEKGLNVHDIEWFTNSEFGKLAASLEMGGYSYDYISDAQLKAVTFTNGHLFANGNSYKTIIVPRTKYMPLNTLNKLEYLADRGCNVIFGDELPEDVPGFAQLDERREEFKKIKAKFFFNRNENNDVNTANIGEGSFILTNDINAALQKNGVKGERLVYYGLNFILRKINDGYYYFITNLSDKMVDTWIPLNVDFNSALIYDPGYENRIGKAQTRNVDGNTEIYLQIKPGESYVVRTFTKGIPDYNEWNYLRFAGEPIEIEGEWKLDFVSGEPGLPASLRTKELKSWTEFGDTAALCFAGTGKYTIRFEMPDVPADEWILDLGEVRESAKIIMNGTELGNLWSLPFEIPVGQYLKSGENLLEIKVTNLSANRIRDLDRRGVYWKKFFFVNIFYKKFDASDWPVMESGLLGPVKLKPYNVNQDLEEF